MPITTNPAFTKINEGKISCCFNNELIHDFSAKMLTSHYWQENNLVTGTAQGRGTTWFVKYNDNKNTQHDWVLRHYYRGGLIGKVNNDSYWFSGLSHTRAAMEFALLQQMQTLKLPAPEPVAFQVVRNGCFYKADLLSTRIKNAQDLVAILSNQALPDDIWFRIGTTIKRFHDQDIYHHDLNSHNILLNHENEVFLIDFDRGEIRDNKEDKSWKKANMSRLRRSFMKELNQLDVFYFTHEDWDSLLRGYLSCT